MVGLYINPEGKNITTFDTGTRNKHASSDQNSGEVAMRGLRLRITELENRLQQYEVIFRYSMNTSLLSYIEYYSVGISNNRYKTAPYDHNHVCSSLLGIYWDYQVLHAVSSKILTGRYFSDFLSSYMYTVHKKAKFNYLSHKPHPYLLANVLS